MARQIFLKDNTGIEIPYTVHTVEEFEKLQLPEVTFKIGYLHKRKPIFNSPVCFDIETSKYEEKSFMYAWTVSVAGVLVSGRSWDEWVRLLHYLKRRYQLSRDRIMVIFIHNLAHEFQYFKFWVPVSEESLFKETREPIEITLKDELEGIKFRCTWQLTGYSLDEWSKKLNTKIKKIDSGDMHEILHTPKTHLTDQEIMYMAADVLSMHYGIIEMQKRKDDNTIGSIPLTKTSYVRSDVRRIVSRIPWFKKTCSRLQLDAFNYMMYKKSSHGGDVYSAHPGCAFADVYGYDIKSSYPFIMTHYEFPASSPIVVKKPEEKHVDFCINKGYLFLIDAFITEVEQKSSIPYLRAAACENLIEPVYHQDRIVAAKSCRICMTSIDFEILKENYFFKVDKITRLVYHFKKAKLPKDVIDYICILFNQKERLYNVPGAENEYNHAKELLNSISGMFATNPVRPIFEYNSLTGKPVKYVPKSIEEVEMMLQEYYKSAFLPYEYGIWIYAYGRQRLYQMINKLDYAAIYWDTDSVKFIGEENKKFFEEENERLRKELGAGKGVFMGMWVPEYQGDPVDFKALGTKQYFVLKGDKLRVTVAGANKHKIHDFIVKNNIDFSEIGHHLEIPENESGHKSKMYNDESFTLFIDGEEIFERSSLLIKDNSVHFARNRIITNSIDRRVIE